VWCFAIHVAGEADWSVPCSGRLSPTVGADVAALVAHHDSIPSSSSRTVTS
jgi:hypothetical protein